MVLLLVVPNMQMGQIHEDAIDVFKTVAPKIYQNKNSYKLSHTNSFVEKAEAESDLSTLPAYVVTDFESGKVLYQKNLSKKLPIASLTKIMSAVVALDLASPTELFTYSQRALSQQATRLAFSPGDKLTLEELLNAALLTSANDCVEAIREGIDTKYGGNVFMRAMNEKARFIGLKNTHFDNPQGFDGETHYSSVEDLAILTHYALSNYPLIAEIVEKDHGELPPTAYHTRAEHLNNWNGLIGVYPGVKGVKIGNTGDAGNTTAVLSEREGKKVLAILLGASGVLERDLFASELLNIGFESFSIPSVIITEEQLFEKYGTWKYE